MSSLPLIVYVDVDDTFIRSFGSKRIPMPPTIKRVRQLYEDGVQLYCWSSGGAEYARASAKEVGLEDCFVAFLPKPKALIDDLPVNRWRLVEIHPNEAATIHTESLRARVQQAQ